MEHICFLCEFEKQFETGIVDEILGVIEKNGAIDTLKLARECGKAVWVFCEEVFDNDGGCVLVVI
jgi:DNA-binding ferritin-like protein (Dps family)